MVIGLVVSSLIGAALAVAIRERLLGRRTGIGACYGAALARIVPLLGTSLLRSAILIGAVVLPATALALAHAYGLAIVAVIIAAVVDAFLYVRWLLLPQAVVLEGQGSRRSTVAGAWSAATGGKASACWCSQASWRCF